MIRRMCYHGYPQGLYTSHHVMPTPFVTNNYINRFINPKVLIDIKYTYKPPNMPLKQFINKYKLPDQTNIKIEGLVRKMEKKDISAVMKLYKQ